MATLFDQLQNLIVFIEEVPLGNVDGINTNFTLSQTPLGKSANLTLNGVRQIPSGSAVNFDYAISGNNISFLTAPFSGTKISTKYVVNSAADIDSVFVWNENLGNTDGITKQFFIANPPISNSNVDVYVDGINQAINQDFTVGPSGESIIFNIAPFSGSSIYSDYRLSTTGIAINFPTGNIGNVTATNNVVSGSIVVFDGVDGTKIKNSNIIFSGNSIVASSGNLSFGSENSPLENVYANDIKVPSQGFVFAHDNYAQNVATGSMFGDVTFSDNGFLHGWSHNSGTSSFLCQRSGFYSVDYSIVAQGNGGSPNGNFETRAVINGVEVSGSQKGRSLGANNTPGTLAHGVIINIQSGDTFKLQMASTNNSAQISGVGNSANSKNSATIRIMRLL